MMNRNLAMGCAAGVFGTCLILFPAFAFFVLLPELRQKARRGRVLVLVGAMSAVVVAYLAARAAVLIGSPPAWGAIGPGQRFMLAVNAFGRYAFMSLFPFDRRIAFSDPWELAAFGWPTLVAAAALAVAVWVSVRFRRTAAGIGSLWFVLFILPACNLVPPGPSFLSQRMLFLPTVGTILAVAALVMALRRRRRTLAVLAVLYTGVMAWSAFGSMRVWRNELSLHAAIVAQSPNDGQARLNLARVLDAGGDRQAAARESRRAAELLPGSAEAHAELGRELEAMGALAGADSALRRAVLLDSGNADVWNSLGDVLLQRGDARAAAGAYGRAVRLSPGAAVIHNNLGVALQRLGDLAGAEAEFRRALELASDLHLAHNNLGELLAGRGQPDSALVEFQQALKSREDYVLARFNLGVALQVLGRRQEARAAFEQVLRQSPDFPGAAERLQALTSAGSR